MAATRIFTCGEVVQVSSRSPKLTGELVTVLAIVEYMDTGQLWVRAQGGSPTLICKTYLRKIG